MSDSDVKVIPLTHLPVIMIRLGNLRASMFRQRTVCGTIMPKTPLPYVNLGLSRQRGADPADPLHVPGNKAATQDD